jgi:hypothetical protein
MQHWVSVQGKAMDATEQELDEGKKDYDAYEAVGASDLCVLFNQTRSCLNDTVSCTRCSGVMYTA